MDVTAIEYASLTDVGVRRSHNQDDYAVMPAGEGAWEAQGSLFLVADGMGAHAVGELASKLATDLIPHTYQKHAHEGGPEALQRAFQEANAAIYERGQKNPEFEGMGTTGTAVLLRPEGAWVAHVGDSRAYRIRPGRIEQISCDHSLQWELARRQRVPPEKLTNIPSNVILRSLGPDPTVEVDIEGPHPLQPGDAFLLCSDGLSGQVSDEEIGAIVSTLPPQEACRLLVDLANLRGGPDNITVILVRLPGNPGEAASAAPPTPEYSWRRRFGWPEISLVSGVAFALLSVLFIFLRFPILALLSFLTSLSALLGGFLGTYLAVMRERKRSKRDSYRPPRAYRHAACDIDAALLDRFEEETKELGGRIRASGHEVDWELYHKHANAAGQRREGGDLTGAFQELCRGIAAIMGRFREYGRKAERFQPLWVSRSSSVKTP